MLRVPISRSITTALGALLIGGCFSLPLSAQELKVMTFNLWHGGEQGGQPLEKSIEAIRAAGADIVGLQETHGLQRDGKRRDNGKRIAEALGWHYWAQDGRRGILSRYPIEVSNWKDGALIKTRDGKIAFFNVHFAAAPYQPYQLLNIPYGNAPFISTETEAIEWAAKSRGKQVQRVVSEIDAAKQLSHWIFLTGDFNEPSHQDWTRRAVDAGLCPIQVAFPSTSLVAATGLVDAFRAHQPNVVLAPGYTWTPTTTRDDPKDKHDRIDFVWFHPKHADLTDCRIVGEPQASKSEKILRIAVEPWPSDHRAVVATVLLRQQTAKTTGK